MIHCFWENFPGGARIPICACPVEDPGGEAAEVLLFPAGGYDLEGSVSLPDPAAGNAVALSEPCPVSRLFPAVVLAQADAIIKALELSPRVLLFAEGLVGEAIRAALAGAPEVETVVARIPLEGRSPEAGVGELDPCDPGFTDSLKAMTGGEGFTQVILASSRPEMVRRALGSAAVLGRVYFLLPAGGRASVDLTATVNFKSLILRGWNFFSGLEKLTASEVEEAMESAGSLSPVPESGAGGIGFAVVDNPGGWS